MRRLGCLTLLALLALDFSAFCQTGSQPDPGNSQSDPNSEGFQWGPAIGESLLEISLAHVERVTTQPDTRNAISGPFWQNYADSIENLHGFNDGDGFFTSYVLHPMEGSFAGFIERQNDPKYRDVEFGTSERYWISCMRSLAFASAFSTVWSATPLGEPGVGNVELHNEPGVVDLVGTETFGLGWMVGEDALDRYVIKRLEQHVKNPYIRAVARSVLNPMRSYANVLALRVPWHRDSRPGVFAYRPQKDEIARDNGPKFDARAWPENTGFELQADSIEQRYLGSKGSTCIGGGGKGAIQLAATDLAFQLDGCELYGLGKHVTGDALNYLAGQRWRPLPRKRWAPSLQLLAGGTKITHVTFDPEKQAELKQRAPERRDSAPEYSQDHHELDTNGFTVLASAGVSYRINELLSWEVGDLSYQRSWSLSHLDGFDYTAGLRFTTGLAITMGPWRH